jgi:hypothetical protein
MKKKPAILGYVGYDEASRDLTRAREDAKIA